MKESRGKIYVFLGEPGSGKSTQVDLIQKKLKVPRLNMGESLRNLSRKPNALGRRIASYVDRGRLVPLLISKEVVRDFLRSHAGNRILLFDGYPRSMGQVRDLQSLLKDYSFALQVIFIKIGKREAIERLKRRLLLEKRKDDRDRHILERRFRIFNKKTLPVLSFYRHRGLLQVVDGKGSIKQVFGRIIKVLE